MEIVTRLCFWGGVAILLLVGGSIATLVILAAVAKFRKVIRWEEADRSVQLRHTQPASLFPGDVSWEESFGKHFGSPPPRVLVDLYAAGSVAFYKDFFLDVRTLGAKTERLGIASFRIPAKAFTEEVSSLCGHDAYALADDGMGNLYFVRPSELTSGDGPVYLYDHDQEACQLLADSFAAFLSAPRFLCC
ncbi:MAG: SMI1/KNR4 family protein [Lentisphaeria bacterium]|nr:SMI1/KNR4 family protein [Lentisphaeria bacterium]